MLGITMLYVLLIAAANVTNLFLLRSERLRQEIAITVALGGGRLALARRFAVEGTMLGAAGGLAALPIVALAVGSSFGFSNRDIPRLHEIRPGAGPLAVALAVSVLIGAIVALLAFVRAHRARLDEGSTGCARCRACSAPRLRWRSRSCRRIRWDCPWSWAARARTGRNARRRTLPRRATSS
jgi:putative ABC transport system permease protein